MDTDLLILVPDKNTEAAIAGILSRPEALSIPSVNFKILVHPEKDPGCRLHGHELLRLYQNRFGYTMMLFDREGCGLEAKSRDQLEAECEDRLNKSGWADRSAVICLDPEIDIWIWSSSSHVDRILGWDGRHPPLREWLPANGFPLDNFQKPHRPKEALEAALREVRKPRSSSVYSAIARSVSFKHCSNPPFLKLRHILGEWFGPR